MAHRRSGLRLLDQADKGPRRTGQAQAVPSDSRWPGIRASHWIQRIRKLRRRLMTLDQIYQAGLGTNHETGLQAVYEAGKYDGIAASQVVVKGSANQANLAAIQTIQANAQ